MDLFLDSAISDSIFLTKGCLMDDFESLSTPSEPASEEPIRIDDIDKPIAFEDSDDKDIPIGISNKPLNLGSGVDLESSAKLSGGGGEIVSDDRITGVKTFFTKLHAGAIVFLDGQITDWLKQNPGIKIKKTNTVSGLIVGKKTEPSIIISVWY